MKEVKLCKRNTRRGLSTQFFSYMVNLPKSNVIELDWEVGDLLSVEQLINDGKEGLFISKKE